MDSFPNPDKKSVEKGEHEERSYGTAAESPIAEEEVAAHGTKSGQGGA
jgi:hypothetical protein